MFFCRKEEHVMQEAKTTLQEMNLVDQFLFDEVMEDQDVFEAVVSILLGEEIKLLTKPETEKEFRVSPQLRGGRLDCVGADVNHKVYMIEMQKKNTRNLEKRSRFYQGHVDVSLLEPGSRDFNSLKDVCQIMITPFDLFGRGLYRYTFVGVCIECPDLKIGDGAWRVFINTKGRNPQDFSQEFLDFMGYIMDSSDTYAKKTDSAKIKLIHKQVTQVKKSEKTGVKFMQRWEELAMEWDEGWEEGKEAGSRQRLVNQACRKLRKGKIPEEIAEDLEETLDVISSICRAAAAFAPDFDEEKVYHAWKQELEAFACS